jgi:hypothetical protein
MIKWRLPSTAPRDGSAFVAKKSNGELDNCRFDQDEPSFLVFSLIGTRKRRLPNLTDHVGWAPWQVLFRHIADTVDDIDRDELNDARTSADFAAMQLRHFARQLPDHRERLKNAADAIDRLLKLAPKGDAD